MLSSKNENLSFIQQEGISKRHSYDGMKIQRRRLTSKRAESVPLECISHQISVAYKHRKTAKYGISVSLS
jgi:hypothetical protein